MFNKQNQRMPKPAAKVNALVAVVMATSLSLAAIPAQAISHDTVQARVQRDVLSMPGGSKIAYAQLQEQARDACAPSGRSTLITKRAAAICASALLGDFVESLNDPGVTALHHESKTL